MTFFRRIKYLVSNQLWVPPLVAALLATIAAGVLAPISWPTQWLISRIFWPGDISAASSLLGFIASSMLTVLTTTVSMTLIVLQVASGQFSHQLLRDYIQSRAVKGIFGVFIGVFVYVVVLQRSVSAESRETPPQLAMAIAMLLVFLAIATFVWYVSAVVRMVRVDAIIEQVATRAERLLDAHREKWDVACQIPEIPPHAHDVRGHFSGYVRSIDVEAAARWARKHGQRVVFTVAPGDAVSAGHTYAWAWAERRGTSAADSSDSELSGDELRKLADSAVSVEAERVSDQDLRLSFHQLADIVVRALSTGTNDPSTGRHVITRATPVLRGLVVSPPNHEVILNDKGQPVASVPTPTVRDFLKDFVVPIRRFCSHSPDVTFELLRLLIIIEEALEKDSGVDIAEVQEFVEDERQRLIEGAEQDFVHQHDVELAQQLTSVESLRSMLRVEGPREEIIDDEEAQDDED